MKVKMINNNNLFQCLGICQRLFNFIVNNLIFIGLQRVTTTATHSMRQGPTAVPILSTAKPNRTKVEHHQYQAQAQAQAQFDKPAQIEARSRGPTKMAAVTDVEEEEERIRKRKGKGVVMSCDGDRSSLAAVDAEREEVKLPDRPRSPPPPLRQRQVRPLFDVAVNINEKSDAFIRSRKEAMRMNYNLETTQMH